MSTAALITGACAGAGAGAGTLSIVLRTRSITNGRRCGAHGTVVMRVCKYTPYSEYRMRETIRAGIAGMAGLCYL